MTETESRKGFITPGYLFATVLIVGLFFMWGVANSLNDVLIPQFRKALQLDDFASSLVQSAFYFGYFCFAIPASLVMRRFGYRAAVLVGLALYGTGALLFIPAANSTQYYAFLGALYVIASGLAFLETSANPLIAVMGPAHNADRRLNFAQTFNPIGTMSGSYLGGLLIFSGVSYSPEQLAAMSPDAVAAFRATELAAVKLPYILIAALVFGWALLVAFAKFPPVDQQRVDGAEEGGFAGLKAFPRYWLGVLAQFAYVGAQVGSWSFLIRYAQVNFGLKEDEVLHYVPMAFGIFFAGRLVGTALMTKVNPAGLLATFSLVNVALCLVAATAGGHVGLYALLAESFFMSIMFPTIFSMSLRGLGNHVKAGAAPLVMAIIGGAVITPIMGYVSRESFINRAYLVPAVCFAVVFFFAWRSRRDTPGPTAA
jgi:FHS family L-fucose permease-like MFS transporter